MLFQLRERGTLRRLIETPRLSFHKVFDELRPRHLGLSEEDVVGLGQVLGARRDIRAAAAAPRAMCSSRRSRLAMSTASSTVILPPATAPLNLATPPAL